MEWIDLTLLADDEALKEYLEQLYDQSPEKTEQLQNSLLKVIGLSEKDAHLQMIRLLIEKARPFALPLSVWKRESSQSGGMLDNIKEHLSTFNLDQNQDRLLKLQKLHRNFHQGRKSHSVDMDKLIAQNYSCALCGYGFDDQDLKSYGIASIHTIPPVRHDKFKPIWNLVGDEKQKFKVISKRKPAVDHNWAVSLYGGNDSANLSILCTSCNTGKSNYQTAIQTKPGVGLPKREHIISNDVDDELFFTCVNWHKKCNKCKKGPGSAELTVRKVDPNKPLVLDNLAVFCYDCITT